MFRSPSRSTYEYDDRSSPDPLASSYNDENEAPSVRHSSPTRRAASPSKYSTVVEDFRLSSLRQTRRRSTNLASSPSRTVTEQTLSPWRIRVTVEAEPEHMDGNTKTMTRTVKVPLREASSPSENARIERRGRSSQTANTKGKRNGTPLRARSNSRNRRQSLTDLDITVLGDDEASNEWPKQKSPRKRKARQSKKKDEAVAEVERDDGATNKEHALGAGNQLYTRRIADQGSFEIRQDTDEEEEGFPEPGQSSQSPELRTIDLNRVSMRSRSISTKQRALPPKDDTIEGVMSAPASPARERSARKVSHISADSYPTPTPSSEGEDAEQQPNPTDGDGGFDTILESEGFTMIDLESLPSARNFLSSPPTDQPQIQEDTHGLETLAKTHLGSSSKYRDLTPRDNAKSFNSSRPRPISTLSYLVLPEGESDISSNVPSSPPVALGKIILSSKSSQRPYVRQITPQPYSSTELLSPPKPLSPASLPIETNESKASPPTLARVVNAGIALQGVLSPKAASSKTCLLSPYQQSGTPKERLDDLFDGFDSGTRRELRAGLRLGEELAKRQKSSPNVQSRSSSGKCSIVPENMKHQLQAQPQLSTQVWRGETVVQHTPVNSLQQKENVAEKQSATSAADLSKGTKMQYSRQHTPETRVGPLATPSGLDTMAKREKEWQLEREAVSREIENASSSQVILIDSDSDGDEMENAQNGTILFKQKPLAHFDELARQPEAEEAEQDDEDLWLEEAEACNSSNSNIQPADDINLTQEQQRKQRDRAREVLNRPRRSLIPSPWKRGEDVGNASTFLTEGDMTGLFFQQPKDMIKFGAGDIARQKRQTSSSFEIDRSREETEPAEEEPNQDAGNRSEQQGEDHSGNDDVLTHKSTVDSELAEDDVYHDHEFSAEREADDAPITEDTIDSSCEASEVDHNDTFSSYNSPSLPHQPIKIPVNFNDSTLSNVGAHPPPLTRSSPSLALDSSRPTTPRSAIKGSRVSLGLESACSPSARKVVFSDRSHVRDVHGSEGSEMVRTASPVPPPRYEVEKEVVAVEEKKAVKEQVAQDDKKDSWLGWLWGKQKTVSNTDGAGDEEWEPTKASIPSASTSAAVMESTRYPVSSGSSTSGSRANSISKTPSYLLPPSYPSDPRRDPNLPLATSGDFTNTHFRTLHIIHAKSQRPRFHGPKLGEVRTGVMSLAGKRFSVDESSSGLGMFEWSVGEVECMVVERFMREVEFGWKDRKVAWGWSEREIMERLFRIVVGEVVRAEEGNGRRGSA